MHNIVIHYVFRLYTVKTLWLSGGRTCLQGRRCRRYGFDSWVGKIPWRRAQQPDPMGRGACGLQSMGLHGILVAYLFYTEYFVYFILLNCPTRFPL